MLAEDLLAKPGLCRTDKMPEPEMPWKLLKRKAVCCPSVQRVVVVENALGPDSLCFVQD